MGALRLSICSWGSISLSFAWYVDSKNAILVSDSCLRRIVIRRHFEDTLEWPIPEFRNEVLAPLSATPVQPFTPNYDSICIDCDFEVFLFNRRQFNFDNQESVFRDVNVGIGHPPFRVGWIG